MEIHTPVISVFRKMKQESHEFEARMDWIVILYLKPPPQIANTYINIFNN
jgi:hypothetical protein